MGDPFCPRHGRRSRPREIKGPGRDLRCDCPPPNRLAFSTAIFAWHEGKVLLIKHKLLGVWLPVGGELEAGERPIEGAARELLEETGLRGVFPAFPGALTGAPPGLIGFEEHAAGPKGTHLNFNFVALVPRREIVGDGSFTDHVWHHPADLVYPGPTPDSVQECMHRIHVLHLNRCAGACLEEFKRIG